ncbi:MAG: PriCT-2 domain-containing protein [Rhizobium sp.]|nr:PriCT-2 domain-containing protein [Rhizobium sp.]
MVEIVHESNYDTSLLSALWGADDGGDLSGVHYIAEPADNGWRHHPVDTLADAVSKAKSISSAGRNAYFACAGYRAPGNRKAENAKHARAVWLDLDCGEAKAADGKGYPTKRAAADALAEFVRATGLPGPNAVVDSGNGLHVYWALDADVPPQDWIACSRLLKALTEKHGLLADRSRTSDIASVLRVPGTLNWKDSANPKPVKLKHINGTTKWSALRDAIEAASVKAAPAHFGLPGDMGDLTAGVAKNYPPMTETPENVALVKSMTAAIPADCERDVWRDICWAVLSTGWGCAEQLAQEWSMTAPDKFDAEAFAKLVSSFKPGGGIGFGTLVHYARGHGYTGPTPGDTGAIEGERFTGSGGDVANGRVFARIWRNKLLFIHETGEVLRFDGCSGWVNAPPGEEDRAAKTVLTKLHDKASAQYKATPDDPKTKRLMAHVERTSKAGNLRAMIEMAKSEPGMTASVGEFDSDPLLLGVTNGVLDLRHGQLLPVSPDLLISKRCAVAFDGNAECQTFMRFLEQVLPDKDMRGFLQRWVGYCLTGGAQEQKFTFFYGGGANGKSVLVELMAWMLGDYSRKIATEMLMHHQRSPQGPSPDIVALKGRRFVYANETEEGRRLAEARIKDMTGGDTLTGRVPYGKADITFVPTHKLVIVGNHRPEITDNSFGMWRRVALVPFEVTVPESARDAGLLGKLKAEGSGILNWALKGLRMWLADGLAIPQKIEAATAAYREDQDVLGDWINDHCDVGAGRTESKAKLYRAYRSWALANGHHPLAQGRLTRRLNERGFHLLPDKRNVGGLALNPRGQTCV